MADDPSNGQYSSPPFNLGGNYASTGLGAGSPGIQDEPPGVGGGGVIAEAVVSAPFGSSQLPENVGHLPVTAGDTSAMSDDMPIHDSPLLPGAAYASVTGIGGGHVRGPGAS